MDTRLEAKLEARREPVVTKLARRLYEAYAESFGWEDPYAGAAMLRWAQLSCGKKWKWRELAITVLERENPPGVD